MHAYQESGYPSVAVDAGALLDGTLDADSLFTWVKQQLMPVLIYSDAIDKDMQTLRTHSDFAACSAAMERFMAEMSRLAYAEGYERIVVAGGRPPVRSFGRWALSFFIERSVDPGVPILRPLDSPNHTLILKSGNFGSRDFFKRHHSDPLTEQRARMCRR
ncbi:MAG: nucleotide-binding domain containing protein [Merdibacter sp.]